MNCPYRSARGFGERGCGCGCDSELRCYMRATHALAEAIQAASDRGASRLELDRVFSGGMAALGADKSEIARAGCVVPTVVR